MMLALYSCTTLIHCLSTMGMRLIAANAQGTVLSILFARAISNAPALQGLVKSMLGLGRAGEPGCGEIGELLSAMRREGEIVGLENERR